MAKKNVVAGELYESITGQLFEIGRQLRQPNGYPFNPEVLKKHLQEAIEGKFTPSASADPRFEFVKEFKLTVSTKYDHGTQIGTFTEKHRKEFYYFNDEITDGHFAKATRKLEPGKTYTVKLVNIKKRVTSEDCVAFLASQSAILAGAQGASLVYQEANGELPKGKYYVSFDEKNAFWEDEDGRHRVPYVDHGSGGGWRFHLGYFESCWDVDYCLVCFCD